MLWKTENWNTLQSNLQQWKWTTPQMLCFNDNGSERDELAKFKWNLYPAALRSFF